MSPEYKTFVSKLLEKTINKMAIWNKTSRENEFILKLADGSVSVDSWLDDDNEDLFVDLRIWNNKGEVIDILTHGLKSPDYPELKNLHDVVKRSYLKIDDTLKSFIKELDSNKVAGEEDELPF